MESKRGITCSKCRSNGKATQSFQFGKDSLSGWRSPQIYREYSVRHLQSYHKSGILEADEANQERIAHESSKKLLKKPENRAKELKSHAENQVPDIIQSLSEGLHNLQVAEEARAAKTRKLKEYIKMLKDECANMKKELGKAQEQVQHYRLELHNALNDVADAESRAHAADEKFRDLEKKMISADDKGCVVCLTNEKDLAFGCGHMTCRDCGSKLRKCPFCRKQIANRIRLYN